MYGIYLNVKKLDYHDLYLTVDLLLLADIWDIFKSVCYNVYKLDVSYYYTSPGLSRDAFLKCTDQYYMKKYKNILKLN